MKIPFCFVLFFFKQFVASLNLISFDLYYNNNVKFVSCKLVFAWCVFVVTKRDVCVFCRLAVLGKLNSFVKEWIAEISESKVSKTAGLLT